MFRPYLELPRTVYVLCLGTFINRAGTFLLIFLTLYLKEARGLSVEFATFAMGLVGLGGLVAAAVGGHLADTFGRRRVMAFSLFGNAVIMLFFGFLSSKWAIAATLTLFSMISEMYRPAVAAMIADVVEPARRVHAFGLMYVSINLGFTVAPVVGGLLVTHSFHWLFRADAITTFAYFVMLLLAVRETLPARLRKPSIDGGTTPPVGSVDPHIPFLVAARSIVTDRVFFVFLIASLVIAVVFVQSLSTLPLFMKQLGHDATTYGRIIAVNGLMIVCFQVPLTVASARIPRGMTLIVVALLYSLGFGLTGLAVEVWHFVGTVVIWTIAEMLQSPHVSAITSDLAPVELRARYMGAITMCYNAATLIGVPIGGMVFARWGSDVLWSGCAIVGLLSTMLFASIRRKIGVRRLRDLHERNETATTHEREASETFPTVATAEDVPCKP